MAITPNGHFVLFGSDPDASDLIANDIIDLTGSPDVFVRKLK